MDRLGWIVLREGTLDHSYRGDRNDRGQHRRSKRHLGLPWLQASLYHNIDVEQDSSWFWARAAKSPRLRSYCENCQGPRAPCPESGTAGEGFRIGDFIFQEGTGSRCSTSSAGCYVRPAANR